MAISLRLDDQLSSKLAAAARAKGVSKSALIRECLDQYLNGEELKPSAWELGKHLFGRYDSGQGNLSVRAHDIAREHVHAQHARKVVVDSGPIIALFDAGDAHHHRALEFVRQSRAQLFSTMAVITEAMYVLDESLQAQLGLLAWIHAGAVILAEPQGEDFTRISDLLEKYADLPMDFTDAVVVALCERLGINYIASVDGDFAIYRFRGRTKFINVFLA